MFGIRILIYLLGIALVVWILYRLARKPDQQNTPVKHAGDMVQCAYCGTFVPKNEAVQANGRNYCSKQHQENDRKSG